VIDRHHGTTGTLLAPAGVHVFAQGVKRVGTGEPTKRLKLEVRLMDDPCLWRWDIKDDARDAVVQSSWDQEWTAYPSREEAYRAGRERLVRVSGADRAGRFREWRFGASE
jgi:hypothetical protein